MACRQRRRDFDRFEKRRSSRLSTGTRRPGEGGVLPPSSASRRGRLQEKIFFFDISRRSHLRPIAGAGPCTRPQAAVSCRRLCRAGSRKSDFCEIPYQKNGYVRSATPTVRSFPRRSESEPAATAGVGTSVGTSVRSFHGEPATATRFRPI